MAQCGYTTYYRNYFDNYRAMRVPGVVLQYFPADSSSVANTTSAQRAGEVDATATTEADGGRPGCDRAAAQGRLGRASDRARAWPVAQRDQRGARARTGRHLRRRAVTGRGGSAARDVGQSWQPTVCRGGEAAAAAAGA